MEPNGLCKRAECKRWRQDSSSNLQRGQMVSPISENLDNNTLVGKQSAVIRHKSILSLSWIFVFQIWPRVVSWLEGGFVFLLIQFADLTYISPVMVWVQVHLSFWETKERGIFCISLTVCSSKRLFILVKSQVFWLSNCDTNMAEPGLAPSLGIGMKDGRSRIQGSFQVLIEFTFPTRRQAHRDNKLLQNGDELPTVC